MRVLLGYRKPASEASEEYSSTAWLLVMKGISDAPPLDLGFRERKEVFRRACFQFCWTSMHNVLR